MTNIKNEMTDLCASRLLPNDFKSTSCEIKSASYRRDAATRTTLGASNARLEEGIQGYLAHKKRALPLGPPHGPRNEPTEESGRGVVSYERGTPAGRLFKRSQERF